MAKNHVKWWTIDVGQGFSHKKPRNWKSTGGSGGRSPPASSKKTKNTSKQKTNPNKKFKKKKMAHNSVPRATQKLRTCMQVATGLGLAWVSFPGPGGVKKPWFLMIFGFVRTSPGEIFHTCVRMCVTYKIELATWCHIYDLTMKQIWHSYDMTMT